MARPIFHIGFHKTATSWFQARFYPHAVSHRFVDRVRARQALIGGSAFGFDACAARRALGFEDGAPAPLICDEDLSGFLHLGLTSSYVAKEIAGRLHAVAPDAQVVIFVRNQPAMIASAYQQYVREGGTAAVRRYLFPDHYAHPGKSRPFKLPGFCFRQFDYAALVDHYDALFGRENVHLFAYEELARDRGELLARMMEQLGLDVAAPAGGERPVNASFRRGLLPLVRALNLFTSRSVATKRTLIHLPYWYPLRKALTEQLNRLAIFGRRPTPEALLGPAILRWIGQHYWAGNRRLAARMGVDLEALGYPVAEPEMRVARPARSPALAWIRN